MKIGLIAHLKHPIKAPFAGGLEAFTFQICQLLKARGHEVTLFASSSSDPGLDLHSILSDERYDEKTRERKNTADMSSEYIAEHHAYYQLMNQIDSLNFDVIFNNSLHYVPITMANLLKTPMVTVLHTPPFYELELAAKAERKNKSLRYVTVSKSNADRWNNIVAECEVIMNGVDCGAWDFYDEGQQENYAVWFGRIHPDKGLHLAIAAARLAGIPLKIAGGIADKKYFSSKVEPLLDEHTQMVGLLDHHSLNKLIGKARVSIISPVWEEPFGLVVAESLACGTPVAGFSIGALPEIVNDKCGSLAAPGDVAGLSAAIKSAMLLNRTTVRTYAEDHLSIGNMVSCYEEFLQSQIDTHITQLLLQPDATL